MKQQIMEKLFNNQELTTEEILFIGKSLPDNSSSNTTVLPYNHANEQDCYQAIGVNVQDVLVLDKALQVSLQDRPNISRAVEIAETLVTPDTKNVRILLLQCIRNAVMTSSF